MEPRGRRSVVASGKTVEDAIVNGLTMLGARRDQVDIEVLHPGSRGLLGIGAENARVQLVVKAPPLASAQSPRQAPVERSPAPESAGGHAAPEPEAPERVAPKVVTPEPLAATRAAPESATSDVPSAEAGQVGREILADLLTRMGFQVKVEATIRRDLGDEGQPPPLVLNIRGEDLGILIGRRGETLSDLQYLVRLIVSHRMKHWTDLVVDVESYRSRRRRALESLATRVAERVAASGRLQALEPMPAYERRVVHVTLRNHPLVTTQSVGVGEKRKVTIVPRK
ncbi:MAG: Jag N-terminal domain-containing protein [Anaerolineae bacterium]|nr:Jag N-terminal domain-containing protein [Anaerolineae bacterium]